MFSHKVLDFTSALRFSLGSYIHGRIRTTRCCQLGGQVTVCGILIESNALIFLCKEQPSTSNHSRRYVKGLDNSTPESYSKLRRFLLRDQPRRSFLFPPLLATRQSLATPFPLVPLSRPHLSPFVLPNAPANFQATV